MTGLTGTAALGQNRLVNGDFEAPRDPIINADSSTTTFPNWTESVGTGSAVPPGNVSIIAPAALSGQTSAQLVGGTTTAGAPGVLTQNLSTPINGAFSFALKFAARDPAGQRTMNVYLARPNGGAQINLRVINGSAATLGTVQIFDPAIANWQTVAANAVNFSASLSTPALNTLSITGTAGGSYTVTVNTFTTPAPVSYYQLDPSNTPLTSFGRVEFHTDNGASGSVGNSSFVVDDVTFVPEPATAGLLGLGVVGLLAGRRRAGVRG